MSRVAPYSAQDTAQAAEWLDYVSDSFAGISGAPARIGAIQEAIDKLERRGLVSESVAELLAEIYDVPSSQARGDYPSPPKLSSGLQAGR